MAQLVLHSDVAASYTRNTEQPTAGVFTCIWAQAHMMGAAVTGALDSSPHNRGAGETSHPRETENCPIQESAMTPHCRQNKAKLAFKATYLSAATYLSSLILNYTVPSRSISHTNIFPKLSRLLTLPRTSLHLQGGRSSCLMQKTISAIPWHTF